jgi:hypothetical protein
LIHGAHPEWRQQPALAVGEPLGGDNGSVSVARIFIVDVGRLKGARVFLAKRF